MSRTRSRNTIVTTPASSIATLKTIGPTDPSYNNVQQGSIAGIVYNPAYTLTSYPGKVGRSETITDNPDGFGSYNAVSHEYEEWQAPLQQVVQKGYSTEYKSRRCEATSTISASASPLCNAYTGDSAWPTLRSVSDLLAEATSKMQFGVQDAGVSLPVFLGELREMRDVFGSLNKQLRSWYEVARTGVSPKVIARMRDNNASFRDVLEQFSAVDLMFKFGFKPFYNDLNRLLTMNNHLQAQRHRIEGRSYLITRGAASDSGEYTYSFAGTSSDHKYSTHTTYNLDVRTWAMFRYNLTDLPRLPDGKIYLDMMGFDEPVAAFWELLPYSWLIDYLVDIGSCLNGYTGQMIDLPYTVVADGYSVKRVATGTTTFYPLGGSLKVKRSNMECHPILGSHSRVKYSRTVGGVPYGAPVLPTINLPSLGQAWTVFEVALMHTSR